MVKINKHAGVQFRLAGIAICLIAAGCTDSSRTEPLSRLKGNPRVQDVYQTTSPEVVRYDRYTLASTRPADAQRDPLNQIIDIRMPQQVVKTVGEGLRYLLLESGYSLCNGDAGVYAELFSKSLPAVQRSVGPVRLSEALQVLAGPAWRLHVDDVNREVCFVLRDQYRSFTPAQPLTVKSQAASAPAPNVSGSTSGSPHKPFSGGSVVSAGNSNSLNQPLPSPVLQARNTAAAAAVPATRSLVTKVPAATMPVNKVASTDELFGDSARNTNTPSKIVSTPGNASALMTKPASSASASIAKASSATSMLKPTAALPPAPAPSAVKSTLKPALTAVQPLSIAPSGKEWRAETGTTLKETLTRWASEASCENGGHWVVVWPVALDYRIDAPLSLRGNFESVMVQLFELYREAQRPLFASASRFQCLISVSDIPAQGGK